MDSNEEKGTGVPKSFIWIIVVIIVAFTSFLLGRGSVSQNGNTPAEPALAQSVNQNITPTFTPTPSVDINSFCSKTGPAQKQDYLIPYTIKPGDSLQSIAQKELGDAGRTSELITLNDGAQNLTVDSTIYLPPPNIKSSSGHLAEVSGRILRNDNAVFQLTYGGGEKGLGVIMPAYYFKDIPGMDSYKVGDCVTVLLDNGVKAYSIKKIP